MMHLRPVSGGVFVLEEGAAQGRHNRLMQRRLEAVERCPVTAPLEDSA